MKKWLSIGLGIVTATGGFLDAGTIATAGESGAKFGLGLIWTIVLATIAIILLVEMVGRFTAVSKKTYADAIREDLGFKFYLFPLLSEIIAESLMLTAELGGMAVALSLFTGISWHLLFPVAALLVFLMSWRASFDWIENGPAIFGLLTLSFIAAVVALGKPPLEIISTLWRPEIKAGDFADYFYLAAATLDTREWILMPQQPPLFIGDLLRYKLVTSEGKLVGHVTDIQLSKDPEYRILAFIYGRRGLLYRLHDLNPFRHLEYEEILPDKVPWEMVAQIAFPVITLKP
ncbi:MAG TPA: divalent metal cation transporter [Ktedonobacteraceae bacterium]|nr:divalent metal cation transporter [Ktedonobacteraceae bacterium]